jgi:hypothetical protein
MSIMFFLSHKIVLPHAFQRIKKRAAYSDAALDSIAHDLEKLI